MKEVIPGVMIVTDEPITPKMRHEHQKEQAARNRLRDERDNEFAYRVMALGGRIENDKEPVQSETRTQVTGVFDIAPGQELRVRRAWAYLSAHVTKALPCNGTTSPGYRLNHYPYIPQNPTRYSGGEKMLGAVCRAEGYAGGLFEEHFRSYCGSELSAWHIDDPDALGEFVRVLREVSANP
jgi:hypothetical protein